MPQTKKLPASLFFIVLLIMLSFLLRPFATNAQERGVNEVDLPNPPTQELQRRGDDEVFRTECMQGAEEDPPVRSDDPTL